MPDPLDSPPVDHGSDRYDYIEVNGPPEVPLPDWLTNDWMPCPDCRANAILDWSSDGWLVTIAHDETCPNPEVADA